MSSHNDSDTWWIARAENANKIWYGLVLICIGLVIFDFVYHGFYHEKHGYFVFETAVAFHAAYGFGAFIFAVLMGKELRKFLMRPENYYDVPYVPVEDDQHHGHDDALDHDAESHEEEGVEHV
jgi:hypothetical protein